MKLYVCLRKAGALLKPTIFQQNLNDMKINLINIRCWRCMCWYGRTHCFGRPGLESCLLYQRLSISLC